MDRISPTAGDLDGLGNDFSNLSLSTSSPASYSSSNCSFFLPDDLFLSPPSSPPPPTHHTSPHPFAANADYYHRQQHPPSPNPFAANADFYHPRQHPPSPHPPFTANADSYHRQQCPPSPHPFAADAGTYHRRQFAPTYTASSDNRLHRIPAQMIQFMNLRLLDGDYKYVAFFFPTVLNEVKNLILDRHDFRVLERFINACNELQRARLLAAIAADTRTLLRICFDKNGSAILATLIKNSRSWQQILQILRSLSPFFLDLAKGKTGSDILKCCLNHPYFDRDEYILQPIVRNWDQLAFDKYGVFIVKQVVDLTTGDDVWQLLTEITQSSLNLAQHPSGNYLVQHLLEKRILPVTSSILLTLRRQFVDLSKQKYSSNVVESCLKNTTSNDCESIILELLCCPNVLEIYVHMYGNFVMQCALAVTKGVQRELHQKLLDVLKKNLPTVRQCGYYRRYIKKYEKQWRLEGFF